MQKVEVYGVDNGPAANAPVLLLDANGRVWERILPMRRWLEQAWSQGQVEQQTMREGEQ